LVRASGQWRAAASRLAGLRRIGYRRDRGIAAGFEDRPAIGHCASASAFTAETDDRGMREIGTEAVLAPEPPRERLEDVDRDLLLRAAAPADQMTVLLRVRAAPSRDPIVE